MNEKEIIIKLYSLSIHEEWEGEMEWGIRYNIKRVIGGWIYQPIERQYSGEDIYHQSVFVPYEAPPAEL